ncbi:MAG: HAMP domain-containing sensor histidine kinase [Thiofilum sp.]|uniref:sensor histidine kinase n=1 Tax=Thiofilum sp. TaxID=2212733 RepID=UPI0025DDCB48|nr:HAMP domain-containing sensor histidine kinase [Thiofilum sp.]MBK8455382.1 HAMP domain-containing histidine kinase [Thiofilum sp.]
MFKANGIYQKLSRVFVLQMVFISLITVAGVYIAALIVEKVMIRAALEGEARHYWSLVAQDPHHPTPNTDNLLGYVAQQGDYSHLPQELQNVTPGFRRIWLEGHDPILYVEDQGSQRLFLVFDEQSVGKLSFYFGVVPLSLALVVIYLSAWIAYRLSRRTLSPLVSLAQTMRQFDVGSQALDTLQLQAYTDTNVNDEVRVLADSLQEFTERLKRQLQREREFTHDVSHELRTPLAVIRGALELLQKQPLSPLQQRAVDRMETTSRDMVSLIETLLLLARENKHIKGSTPINVNELVKLLMEQINQTHNSDQHVQLTLEQPVILQVDAPSQAIGIVLGNLIRNACNYTQAGKVLIQINKNSVVVSDTGLGMSSTELTQAQQPFERLNANTQGYGLGLDIVKRLCERYGWQLSLNSQVGLGTQVSIVFS